MADEYVVEPLPTGGPTDTGKVKTLLGIAAGDQTDDPFIEVKVASVNVFVRGLPVADRNRGELLWDVSVVDGATMLAARLVRRKNDVGAVDVEAATDPDVSMFLELGPWARPAAG